MQHLSSLYIPALTVAENIFMYEINASKRALVDYQDFQKRAEKIISTLGKDIDTTANVESLSLANQQLVEIAKALALDCKILILDEPTAALTTIESQALFKIIKKLASEGIGIIYISHRMAEIIENCTHVTVLRDGESVFTGLIQETNPDDLIRKMVGRELGSYYPEKAKIISKKSILSVEEISDGEMVTSVSFAIRQGEILGVAGLMGAGRSEIAKAVCGITRLISGTIKIDDQPISIKNYKSALKHGIAYLSEDRKSEGVFLELPIKSNIASMSLSNIRTRFGTVNQTKESEQAVNLGIRLKLKSDGVNINTESLSGGNQQKVAIAKLLATKPKVLFMDEPTRGVDVGAKVEIHQLLRQLANEGVGIVVISSELPEIIGLCDRTIVIREGKIVGELAAQKMSEEAILRLASGLN